MKKPLKYLIIAVLASLLTLTACGADNNTNTQVPAQEPTIETEYETNGQESEPHHHYSDDDTNVDINADSDIISLRLYYHSTEIDPNIYALPESFLYDTVNIPTQNLRDEFIQLMYERIGVQILDLWFVEDKLIVNLHRDSILFFDSHGTAGASIVITIFERTLASMPNITAFEVLLDGGRGFAGHHFDFNHITIVEDGEIVRREFFGGNFGMDEFEIHVDLMSNVNLGFNVLHEVNYNDAFEEIRGFRFDGEGVNLIIWANQPIFNLSLIALDHNVVDFYVAEAVFTVDKLDSAAAEAFVINSYYGMGTMPWSGISFEGTFEGMTGVRRYFVLQQSGYDGRFFLNEFVPAVDTN